MEKTFLLKDDRRLSEAELSAARPICGDAVRRDSGAADPSTLEFKDEPPHVFAAISPGAIKQTVAMQSGVCPFPEAMPV